MSPMCEFLESRESTSYVWAPYLTFSFVPDGTAWLGGPSVAWSTLGARKPDWKDAFRRAMVDWGQAIGFTPVEVIDDGRAIGSVDGLGVGTVRIGGNPDAPNVLARAYFPGPGAGSDVAVNTDQNWRAFDLYSVALHELGHALAGLRHGESPVMSETYQGALAGLVAADVVAARDATDIIPPTPIQLLSKFA